MHRELLPDPEEGKRREAVEMERLAKTKAAMSKDEIDSVIAKAEELKRRQEAPDSPEALATLPALKLPEVPENRRVDVQGRSHSSDASGPASDVKAPTSRGWRPRPPPEPNGRARERCRPAVGSHGPQM